MWSRDFLWGGHGGLDDVPAAHTATCISAGLQLINVSAETQSWRKLTCQRHFGWMAKFNAKNLCMYCSCSICQVNFSSSPHTPCMKLWILLLTFFLDHSQIIHIAVYGTTLILCEINQILNYLQWCHSCIFCLLVYPKYFKYFNGRLAVTLPLPALLKLPNGSIKGDAIKQMTVLMQCWSVPPQWSFRGLIDTPHTCIWMACARVCVNARRRL